MIRVCSEGACHQDSGSGSLAWKCTAFILAMLLTSSPFPGRASLHLPPDWQGSGSNKQPSKKQLTSIDYSLYHRSDIFLEEVKALVVRHPEKMTMKSLKSTATGYSAEIAVVTFGSGGWGSNSNEKIRILLNFGQHGRELITSELALRLLSVLAGEYHLRVLDRSNLNDILQKLVIKVVPMENLNGRKLVEAGKLCERKNGRGVDINRNWGIDWGKKEKDYDPSEEYPGVAPFSEPETQIMRGLAHSFKPHFWVNVHSGMEALFMPYDHRNTTPNGGTTQLMQLMLQILNRLHCKNNCAVGSGGASVGYLAHGTSTDYMYEIVKVPMAFTFEIYGEPKASSDDCFRMFNPTDLSVFESVLENWCAAFFTIFMNSLDGFQNLSTKAFDTQNAGYTSLFLNYQNQSSSYNYSYTERKLSTSRQYFGANSDRRFEWSTDEMRTLFEFFFISSTILLILICYKISKSISRVCPTFNYFYKPRS